MVEASPILASRPSTVITTLARYRARRAVKHQIQAKGLKLRCFTARDIAQAANAYLMANREALFEQAVGMVQSSPELRKLYDREQRQLAKAGHFLLQSTNSPPPAASKAQGLHR